jgi:hypothetical protein
MKVLTPEFRVSFPKLFKPESFQGGDPKYSVVMLFDKSTDLGLLTAAIEDACEKEWGKDKKKWPKFKYPVLRDGDEEKPGQDGYHNAIFAKASSKFKPGIVDEDVQEVIDDSKVYPGCYGRASVVVKTYNSAANKGVSLYLQNFQFLRDGDNFAGKSSPALDFGEAKPASSTMFE